MKTNVWPVRVRIFLLFLASSLTSCGRSAEPIFPCPQPAADCKALIEQQTLVEGAFTSAAAAQDPVLMNESSECVQFFVEQSLDLQCVDSCVELCRLHPCTVVDDDGQRFDPSACADRCQVLADEGAIVANDFNIATAKAAENPGFCTCRACTAPDDALCTRLFDCAGPAQN